MGPIRSSPGRACGPRENVRTAGPVAAYMVGTGDRTGVVMRRAGGLLLLVAGALGQGGCVNPEVFSYKAAYDEPQLLAVTGPVAVEVESFNGDVQILTDPRAIYGSVRLRRQAIHGYGRAADA